MPYSDSICVTDAAKIRGCSVDTIHLLIRDGKLLAEKMGNAWIVRKSDVESLPVAKRGRPRKAKA